MTHRVRIAVLPVLVFFLKIDAHPRSGNLVPATFTTQNVAVVDKFLLTQGPRTNPVINSVPRYESPETRFLKTSPVAIDDNGNITLNGVTKNGNTIAWPDSSGPAGSYLASNGSTLIFVTPPAGSGNVDIANPFATDNRIVKTNTASGASYIQESLVTIDNNGNMSGIQELSAAHITSNLTGAASQNILKSGDSMAGPLVLLTQNEILFQDATTGNTIGLQAPDTVTTNYTIALPANVPTAGQFLCASSSVPTDLQWSGSISNAVNFTYWFFKRRCYRYTRRHRG